MMMNYMDRSTFERQYNYRFTLASDNIDLKHCENCAHLNGIKGIKEVDGCYLMYQCRIPPDELKVDYRHGLCDLHQRKDGNSKIL